MIPLLHSIDTMQWYVESTCSTDKATSFPDPVLIDETLTVASIEKYIENQYFSEYRVELYTQYSDNTSRKVQISVFTCRGHKRKLLLQLLLAPLVALVLFYFPPLRVSLAHLCDEDDWRPKTTRREEPDGGWRKEWDGGEEGGEQPHVSFVRLIRRRLATARRNCRIIWEGKTSGQPGFCFGIFVQSAHNEQLRFKSSACGVLKGAFGQKTTGGLKATSLSFFFIKTERHKIPSETGNREKQEHSLLLCNTTTGR